MTVFDRHMARQLAATLARILVTLVLLAVTIDFLTRQQAKMSRYDIPWSIVGTYYLTFIPTILFSYQTAALAVLAATVMVMGRAMENNEITAMLAGGVSLWRLARVPIAMGLLMTFVAFGVEETLGVRATATSTRLQEEYFSRYKGDDRTGVSWANLEDGWTCHVLRFNRRALTGQDVFLHRSSQNLVEHLRANRILWEPAAEEWLLEDGWRLSFDHENKRVDVRPFSQTSAPFSEAPRALFALEQPAEAKTAGHMLRDLRYAEARGMPTRSHWVDFHAKFARPALCFIMVFLAIPFALRLRCGGVAIGFGLSMATALTYLALFYVGIGLGMMGKLPPAAAAWLANTVFLAVGAVLCFRTKS